MRLTTIYRNQKILRLYERGKREPKFVAEKMNISIDVVYKALRDVFHVEHSSTDTRRKNQTNWQNKSK